MADVVTIKIERNEEVTRDLDPQAVMQACARGLQEAGLDQQIARLTIRASETVKVENVAMCADGQPLFEGGGAKLQSVKVTKEQKKK